MHRGWRATSLVMVGLTVLLTSVFNLCVADEKAAETGSVEKTGKPLNTSEVATINLLADDIEKTWQHFCSKEGVPLKEVWQVVKVGQERHLVCKGDPKGFLFTKQEYANFELTFEWMSPSDPNGNSGVLIYTKKELRLWPTSMQVQLHLPEAGALFASGDATSDKPFDAGVVAKPSEWNTCSIVSNNGQLSVLINGSKAGETEGCKPNVGFIGLQSEGSETHFRRLLLKPLPATAPNVTAPPEKATTEAKRKPVPTDAG